MLTKFEQMPSQTRLHFRIFLFVWGRIFAARVLCWPYDCVCAHPLAYRVINKKASSEAKILRRSLPVDTRIGERQIGTSTAESSPSLGPQSKQLGWASIANGPQMADLHQSPQDDEVDHGTQAT